MVLLRTTGGGRFRFNPNLYNCGKVRGSWGQAFRGDHTSCGSCWPLDLGSVHCGLIFSEFLWRIVVEGHNGSRKAEEEVGLNPL